MFLEVPTVSVVVSAYQNISYLPATIDSILQQTYENFEILVFSDDYHQIYPWFQCQPDRRLRFILQINLGLATTLNQGILEARGKYVSAIKPGDLWHPRKLQKQIFCLDHYCQVDLIHSPSILIPRQSQRLFSIEPVLSSHLTAAKLIEGKKYNSVNNWRESPEILAHNQLVLSSVMLRRSCFERVGLFYPELQITPDWEMWIRLSHYYQFMKTAQPLVYCRQLQENRRENWLKLETDLQIMIEKAYASLPDEQAKHKYRSYSYASLFLAKHVLHHQNPDPAIAHNYWYQALQHDFLIVFSAEFCRLRWIIFSLYCLQSDRYRKLGQLFQTVSDRLKIIFYLLFEYGQKIVDWMLEERTASTFGKIDAVKQQGKD